MVFSLHFLGNLGVAVFGGMCHPGLIVAPTDSPGQRSTNATALKAVHLVIQWLLVKSQLLVPLGLRSLVSPGLALGPNHCQR